MLITVLIGAIPDLVLGAVIGVPIGLGVEMIIERLTGPTVRGRWNVS